MSKDTINPTQNNNMEYTVTNKQVMHLKEGDVIYNHITKDPADFSKITKIMRADGILDDTEITCEDGAEIYCDETAFFLCRVPSSPVMSFEEFCKSTGATRYSELSELAKRTVNSMYEGYLIGTGSIVPEENIREFEKQFRKSFLHGGNEKDHTTRENMLKFFTNYLRSQINK